MPRPSPVSRTRSYRRSKTGPTTQAIPDIVRLWLLRLLGPLGAQRRLFSDFGIQEPQLLEAIGLGELLENGEDDKGLVRLIAAQIRVLHLAAERKARSVPPVLAGNIERIAHLVGLTPTDCRLLEFALYLHGEVLLTVAAMGLGELNSAGAIRALSLLLDLDEVELRVALSPEGALARSGLLTFNREGTLSLVNKLELLSSKMPDVILSAEADLIHLLREMVTPAAQPELSLADYGHIADTLEILLPYLRWTRRDSRHGANVFLHGAPGTGKSQLVKVLAQALGYELFEIASENDDDYAIDGAARLRAFRAAQSFFGQRQALILFDEVEDVFVNHDSPFARRSTQNKAWINRLLEENPLPAFWLSNSADCLDPAYLRRFDLVIELAVPPRRQREQMLQQACGDSVPAAILKQIAASEAVSPALVARAANVLRGIADELPPQRSGPAVLRLLNGTLQAQGHAPIQPIEANRLPDWYDPAYLNVPADLDALADGLERTGSGRLCLYGPPGTGKTAFARWLAERLGKPLLVRRASELLSKWLGESEKNIARAFLQAEADHALLLIDEVDSFLQDRRDARASWEITAVNEMLTRMESYPGLFIASTNLMQGLDPAALRRFDLKLEFGYLKPEQAWRLFQQQCAALGLPMPAEELRLRLNRLAVLTPGDYAAVARQNRFAPFTDTAAMLAALESECGLKEGQRGIGFVQ